VRNLELEGGSLYDYSDPRVEDLELEARIVVRLQRSDPQGQDLRLGLLYDYNDLRVGDLEGWIVVVIQRSEGKET